VSALATVFLLQANATKAIRIMVDVFFIMVCSAIKIKEKFSPVLCLRRRNLGLSFLYRFQSSLILIEYAKDKA
jgi:hypothetical protein